MRKSGIYLAIGVGTLAAIIAASLLLFRFESEPEPVDLLEHYREGTKYDTLTIQYPLDETLFPPEMVSPTFRWEEQHSKSNIWLVSIKFLDGDDRLNFICRESNWTPQKEQWETIKKRSMEREARITILGISHRITTRILSAGHISIKQVS